MTIGVRGIGGGASGWQNLINPYDVDGNGRVTPLDALILVNEINRSGPRKLAPPTAAEPGSPMFLDTNGDGHLTAMDVLMVINYLNQGLLAGSESARAERPAG